MSRVISIVNQKGGVGKTTTAVNLSAYLAYYGRRVLLIDMDPQGNATSGFGIQHHHLNQGIYETLVGQAPFSDIVRRTNIQGHMIAPATLDLAGANIELVNVENREYRLREVVAMVQGMYDYVIIDCPPSLGLLTINALAAAHDVLIPVQTEYYALEGLSQLLNTIHLVREHVHPELGILGAVMTMYDDRYRLTQEVFHELYRYFPNRIFRTVIPRSIALAEAPSYGKSIMEYKPRSRGAKAYQRLAREIMVMNS